MEKIINLGASAQEDVVYESPTRSVTRQEFKVQRSKEIKLGERVAIAEASIIVNAEAITLKASQSSLNALGVRVTTAEASIVVNAGAIALKASQTDLNATNGRVSTAEATILVHTGQIALKASQSSVDAIGTRVTTAEGTIVVQAGQIALKVNTTDLNNTLTSYSTIVQTDTKIALEIGTVRQAGANLVLYTQQDFEQGLIDLSNGAESPSSNGLRTAEYATILPNMDYLLEASGTGLDVANTFIVLYTAGNVFSRYFAFSGGNRKITTLATEVKFKVRMQKTPLTTLLITEMPNFKVSVSLINKYLTGTKYVFDGTGAVFSGGGLTIKNNAGTQVFGADVNGNLEIVGKITASSGDIGGFDILSDRITAGSGTTRVGMSPSVLVSGYYYVFWAGNDSPYSAPFRVQRNGTVSMTSATIGGWAVTSTLIYNGAIKLDSANERIYVGIAYMYESSSNVLGISGILRISSGLYCYSTANFYDVLPLANAYYKLGSSTLRWADIWCSDTTLNGSDIRLKKDIQPIEKGVDLILGLRPVQYKWKKEGSTRPHYGLIANEVKHTMDKLGIDSGLYADPKMSKDYNKEEDPDGFLALRYGELIAPMIQTIQSIDARLKVVEGRA